MQLSHEEREVCGGGGEETVSGITYGIVYYGKNISFSRKEMQEQASSLFYMTV